MKSSLLLALSIALAGLAGCATTPRSAAIAETDPADQVALAEQHCARETGSRLNNPRSCPPGRTFTRDELQSTGRTDVGEALRMLDPSIR